MPIVTAIAELQDVTPGAVFVASNARIYFGDEVIQGDIVVADDGNQVVAAVRVNDSRIAGAARRGQISARVGVRMRGGVGAVTAAQVVSGHGSTGWAEGQAPADLTAACRYWRPRIALAGMAAMSRPALTIPIESRKPGDEVCTLTIEGEIDQQAGLAFASCVAEAAGQTLVVQVNSIGGEIAAGWRMYQALAAHDALVITDATKAYSAALIPFLAGDVRTMQSDATLMVHPPSIADMGGQAAADDLRKCADSLDAEEHRYSAIIAARTGNDLATVSEWVKSETYLDAAQAVALGFVGKILHDQAPLIPVARRVRTAPINGAYQSARPGGSASPPALLEYGRTYARGTVLRCNGKTFRAKREATPLPGSLSPEVDQVLWERVV